MLGPRRDSIQFTESVSLISSDTPVSHLTMCRLIDHLLPLIATRIRKDRNLKNESHWFQTIRWCVGAERNSTGEPPHSTSNIACSTDLVRFLASFLSSRKSTYFLGSVSNQSQSDGAPILSIRMFCLFDDNLVWTNLILFDSEKFVRCGIKSFPVGLMNKRNHAEREEGKDERAVFYRWYQLGKQSLRSSLNRLSCFLLTFAVWIGSCSSRRVIWMKLAFYSFHPLVGWNYKVSQYSQHTVFIFPHSIIQCSYPPVCMMILSRSTSEPSKRCEENTIYTCITIWL